MSTSESNTIDKRPKTARGLRTQSKLLEAAEGAFGENGFHATSIGDITRRASVALGTFYVYFDSKDEIFRALVAHMGEMTRGWIAERVKGAPDRLETEHRGLVAYIEFARAHPNLYRIIEESQFVAPDAYKAHYDVFMDRYQRNLEDAAARGEVAAGDQGTRAWALIGMSVFMGLRFGIWERDRDPEDVARVVSDLIANGLKP
ncbi:MAG: AcrR family transcriptional regulator [Maricaulis maris]|jgi:AcrR family transcriptional regulator|uniref:Transcriptional regulator, TetR family n=1 Tax=Maricaulis maris (strain MCS10) TaxID=394221 RepID=Q0ASY1_MARMM|nr:MULTISPECIES: TetR/AcrR family transcriptional regulator [Maricaulis]ABI64606.1 transcriptional regulator, TetR family [Maricaulis maris MCS10]MAC89011.1 TetR/AcrR family transcriptional regulator [Maricaulis sp.]